MKYPEVEPNADNRAAAKAMREIFVSLVKEGFTETQALLIISGMLTAHIQKPMPE